MKKSTLASLIGIGAAMLLTENALGADDAIKRLLDLQLKKGILTQQEYDDFMSMTNADRSDEKRSTTPVQQKQVQLTQEVHPAPVETKKLKIEVFGTVDLAAGYTSRSLVPSGEMPTTIGPWISGGVKAPVALAKNLTSQTGMFNGALSASAWGIKASRDIGPDNFKAFIYLDSAFNPATGQLIDQAHNQANNSKWPLTAYATSSLNGQLFGREAYIGLSGDDFGKITFGRNNNLILDVLNQYGPLQKAALFTPYGNGVLGGGGSISENGRVDNSVKYSRKFGAFNAGFMYGFGGAGGLKRGAEGYTGNLGYENDRLGVQFVVESFKDLLKTSPDVSSTGSIASGYGAANSLDLTAYDQNAILLAAKYKINDRTRFQTGFQRTKLTNPTYDSNIPLITSIYGNSVASSNSYSGNPVLMNISHVGLDHDFTEKFYAGVAYYNVDMPAYSYLSGSSTKNYLGGKLTAFSVLGIYKIHEGTDVYGGLLLTDYSGPAFNDTSTTVYARHIVTSAVGLRFRF